MSATTPEQRLAAAGHRLPAAPQPRGHYAPFHLSPMPHGGHSLARGGLGGAGTCLLTSPIERQTQTQ